MRIFMEKTEEIASASRVYLRRLGASPPRPPYGYSSLLLQLCGVRFKAVNMFYCPKREQKYSKCSALLLPHFYTYFSLQTL